MACAGALIVLALATLPSAEHEASNADLLQAAETAFTQGLAARTNSGDAKAFFTLSVTDTYIGCVDLPRFHNKLEEGLLTAAKSAWDEAVSLGERHGYRNAQASVLAPTGTIGLMMDCDTTGIEPDLALVKTKKLVGGGTMRIVNQTVPRALRRLGYTEE